MRASMRGVYMISAADHTSVKRRRRPTAPPVQENRDASKQIRAAAAAGSDSEITSLAQTLITQQRFACLAGEHDRERGVVDTI